MKIRFLVMDVDGTLTDGKIYMSANGELFKAFDIKDGYTIFSLDKVGIIPIIITGRISSIVEKRAAELKVAELHQGVGDKLTKLNEILKKYNGRLEEVAYIGDDYNDQECMKACGYSGCPADAEDDIKESVNYICKSPSGRGALREFVKHIVRKMNSQFGLLLFIVVRFLLMM